MDELETRVRILLKNEEIDDGEVQALVEKFRERALEVLRRIATENASHDSIGLMADVAETFYGDLLFNEGDFTGARQWYKKYFLATRGLGWDDLLRAQAYASSNTEEFFTLLDEVQDVLKSDGSAEPEIENDTLLNLIRELVTKLRSE